MKIEYDKLYKKWVVWLKVGNIRLELYRGTKKNCKSFKESKKGVETKWKYYTKLGLLEKAS